MTFGTALFLEIYLATEYLRRALEAFVTSFTDFVFAQLPRS